MSKNFTRKIEDFTCDNCGETVTGNGYTNHCPQCLFSKHVDNNPGDRASECCGLMVPKEIQVKGDTYTITHQCKKCGHTKPNKVSPEDDFKEVVKISSNNIDR